LPMRFYRNLVDGIGSGLERTKNGSSISIWDVDGIWLDIVAVFLSITLITCVNNQLTATNAYQLCRFSVLIK
jgi:hypothetical protein